MLAILSLSLFLIKIGLNTLAGLGYEPFQESIKNVSDTFALDITPAGWAFSIWGLIYTWNAAYIIYALTTGLRDVPPVLNALFYLLYILCDIVNISWLFAFTSDSISSSCAILVGNQVSLYLLLFVVYKNYSAYKSQLEDHYPADAICLKVLIQNGIMINAAWVTIASLLNVAMVLVYRADASMSLSSSLVLAVLLIILLVWFFLENFPLQSYLNYTYLDWPVVVWALSASLAKNWDPDSTSSRFVLALLVITVLLFIARITLQVLRNKKANAYYHRPKLDERFTHCSV